MELGDQKMSCSVQGIRMTILKIFQAESHWMQQGLWGHQQFQR